MDETKFEPRKLPLEHPDISHIFESVINILLGESDRGAVLVGASVVDSFLRKLFEHFCPKSMGKEARRLLFDYPGALSTLSARTDIAYATRLIDKNLHKSINALRKIRNDVAHAPEKFSLENHRVRISEMCSFGEGVEVWGEYIAKVTLIENLITRVAQNDAEREPEHRLFNSREDIIEQIINDPDSEGMLQERALRLQLGIIVGSICALNRSQMANVRVIITR